MVLPKPNSDDARKLHPIERRTERVIIIFLTSKISYIPTNNEHQRGVANTKRHHGSTVRHH